MPAFQTPALTVDGILVSTSGQIVAERVVIAAGAITVATTDYLVTVNKTVGAATTVNLPASPTTGTTFVIHDGNGDAATNNITITPNAGNINGAATLVLNVAYATATLVYNGTQWDAQISTAAGGGGGAPTTSKYLLQVADGSLPNAQAMGALSTGLVKNTTTTGVQSIGAAGTDYTSPTGTEALSNKTITASTLNSTSIGASNPSTGIFTTLEARGILFIDSGVVQPSRVVTAAGAIGVVTTDYMVTVNKTVGAATTVNLPASPVTGMTLVIHDGKGDAATNNITITPNAGNINGAATLVLTTNYATAMIIYNGTQWDAAVISGLQATNYSFCQGRLTPTSGTPVLSADITGAAMIYWTPYNGNQIGLYNGTTWDVLAYAETSLSLTGLVQNTMYDIFAYNNAGTLALEALAWNTPATGTITTPGITNASPPVVTSTAHGLAVDQIVTIAGVVGSTANNGTWRVSAVTANTFTLNTLAGAAPGAPGVWTSGGTWWRQDETTLTRATALVYQNGILCKTGALTRRYLGTIRIQPTAAGLGGQTEDSELRRFIYNHYNQIERHGFVSNTTQHTYAVATWQSFNNDYAVRTQFVLGQAKTVTGGFIGQAAPGNVATNYVYMAVYVDTNTGVSSDNHMGYLQVTNNAGTTGPSAGGGSTGPKLLGAGYHYISYIEQSASGTGTFTLVYGNCRFLG